jgi:hypothetical protein
LERTGTGSITEGDKFLNSYLMMMIIYLIRNWTRKSDRKYEGSLCGWYELFNKILTFHKGTLHISDDRTINMVFKMLYEEGK